MWCFEVSHFNENSDDVKMIGYFSSLFTANSAIAELKKKPGFCETENGFWLVRRWVDADVSASPLFEALVYYHSTDYSFEHEINLGLFASRNLAEEAMQRFREDNAGFAADVEAEFIINRCVIDYMEWAEGFTTEQVQENV